MGLIAAMAWKERQGFGKLCVPVACSEPQDFEVRGWTDWATGEYHWAETNFTVPKWLHERASLADPLARVEPEGFET